MEESKLGLIILLGIVLILLVAFTLYEMIAKNQPVYIQFSIISVLCTSICTQIPSLSKHAILPTIFTIIAVVLLVVGIVTEI